MSVPVNQARWAIFNLQMLCNSLVQDRHHRLTRGLGWQLSNAFTAVFQSARVWTILRLVAVLAGAGDHAVAVQILTRTSAMCSE